MRFYRFHLTVAVFLMIKNVHGETDINPTGVVDTQMEVKPTTSTLVSVSTPDLESEKKICIENKCAEKSGNGECDEECNRHACNFDGYECSLGIDPWKDCFAAANCSTAFMDGNCDETCNNAQCLFDGRDCERKLEACKPVFEDYCRKHYANGLCDYGCNVAECDWDGFDCEWPAPYIPIAEGAFSVVVQANERSFRRNVVDFLRDIGIQLRASVRVKKDESGKDMIFTWKSGSKNRTNVAGTPTAVIVYLEVDNRKCSKNRGTACFAIAAEAAAYLAAMETKKSLKMNFPIGK